jgi:hypothetical protein
MGLRIIRKKFVNCKIMMALFCIVVLILLADSAYSQTVRGRLDRRGPSGYYPAAYVKVTLGIPNQWRSLPVYTGVDGMYYFYNIRPGNYVLEIWGYRDPIRYEIQVLNQPYTDIKPILLP